MIRYTFVYCAVNEFTELNELLEDEREKLREIFVIERSQTNQISINGRPFHFSKKFQELDEVGKEYYENRKLSSENTESEERLVARCHLEAVFDDCFPLEYEDIKFMDLVVELILELYFENRIPEGYPEKGLEVCEFELRELGGQRVNKLPTTGSEFCGFNMKNLRW